MNCPYCNKEMQLGVIHGDRYSLKWILKEKDKPFTFMFTKGIKLSDAFIDNSVESYFCDNCQKIIIDVPKDL